MFDFDAVKALLGDDRSFALEILVSGPHPNPGATRSPHLARDLAPTRAPWLAHIFQGDFLKEADADVGKIAAVLDATPANMRMSLQEARPTTETRRPARHTARTAAHTTHDARAGPN